MVLPRPFLSLWPNKINYVKLYKRTNSYIIFKKKLSDIQENYTLVFYLQDKTEALFRILQEIWFNRSILISLDMKTIEQHCNSALLHQKKEEGTFIHSQDTSLWFTFESALYPIRFPRTKFISSTATSTWVNLYSIDIFELWFSISKYIKEGLDLRFLIKISPNWFIEVRK